MTPLQQFLEAEREAMLQAVEYVLSHPEEGCGDSNDDVRKVIAAHDARLIEKVREMVEAARKDVKYDKTICDICGGHQAAGECGCDSFNAGLDTALAILTLLEITKPQ